MITGIVLLVAGLSIGLSGAFRFNFGTMMTGWLTAFAGGVLIVASLVNVIFGWLP